MNNKILFLAAAMLTACADEEFAPTEADTGPGLSTSTEVSSQRTGATVLGEQIPNAYTPEAMREALEALKAESGNKSATVSDVDITATHLYLKFAPRDSNDVALLDNDTTIMYTVIPMDREIAEIGEYYHDPSLPDSVPTFQYCVARIGQALPDVPHETLSELFLMEEANVFEAEGGDDEESVNKSAATSLWEELEDKALALAGMAEEDEEEESVNKSSKWRPQGKVLYSDNSVNKTMPMEGVPVRITRGFVTHQCCTDKNGKFSFSKRRHHVRVYIKWRRDYFHIREISHPIQQAESTIASQTKKSVSHTFVPGYDSWRYASVFRAAHQYYYNHSAYGLSRPKDKNLIIRLSNLIPDDIIGCYHSFAPLGLSDIRIFYLKNGNLTSRGLFQTTAHEIAHCAHCSWGKSKYWHSSEKVQDSWARGVEIHMARSYFPDGLAIERFKSEYTLVVRDLMDDDTSKKIGLSGLYTERASGISMKNIEKALKGATSWNKWRDNLVKLYPSKKEEIYEVFAIWAD